MTAEQRLQLLLPFPCKDIQWRISHTTKDKSKGFAIPYIDKRAIQNLLDSVVGYDNWKDETVTIMGQNAKEAAHICKISIYFPERNDWITKSDGAGSTDYQPVKGGLSDAFKRAASMWGIARFLYDFEGVWVSIDSKKMILQSEYEKLDTAYSKFAIDYLKTLPLSPQQYQQAEAYLKPPVRKTSSGSNQKKNTQKQPAAQPIVYQVQAVQYNGTATYLQLMNQSGQSFHAVYPNQISLQPGQIITIPKAVQQADQNQQPYILIQELKTAA